VTTRAEFLEAAFDAYGWTDLDPIPGRYETGQEARWTIGAQNRASPASTNSMSRG
jgi:hypothetical protein